MGRQGGFTITELMVVTVVVAILLSIAIPSYQHISNSYRMSAEINALVGDLMYARAEAIKEGQYVGLCVSSDGLTCSGTTTWESGWIVFPDPAGNGSGDVPASVLHVQQAFTGTDPDRFVLANAISSIIFNREGFAQADKTTPFGANQFALHDKTSNPAWTRCLLISAQGMIQTETHANPTFGACN